MSDEHTTEVQSSKTDWQLAIEQYTTELFEQNEDLKSRIVALETAILTRTAGV